MKYRFYLLTLALMPVLHCKFPDEDDPLMVLRLKFNANQERLDNLGEPAVMPTGHAAQTPDFRKMSIHYVELAPSRYTQLGEGVIVYKGKEITHQGESAVDFEKAAIGGNFEDILDIDRSKITPGTYEYVRVSVTYQNYDVLFNLNHVPVIGDLTQQKGTVASFVGFNTYIGTVTPNTRDLIVNDSKKQGFWAFETAFSSPYEGYNQLYSGQAPAGATTVVNPLFGTSDIPAGSCLVTGKFNTPLVITGKESYLHVNLSFSINNSFEWVDTNGNGQWDLFADLPSMNEKVVDMGLRGLEAKFE